ncbi:BadF/BadG/BcrA/BcrD ATPase family protein [Amycolatopsis mediterranei]|uniref:N-acetylglucosamine kinase n=1 Tax=Amycolatopsis mediterranei TaxID=33910 RepID=UPI0034445555
MSFAVGVDAGGTSTRAALVDATGAVLGTGRGDGANPNAHAPEVAADRIAGAITAALGAHDPGAVRACVVGMAGVSKLSDQGVAAVFTATWARIGLTCPVRTVADAEVAYASATPAPDGTVVVAGTGSIVGRIRKRRLAGTTGGYGWLLGDEGSAFWLGREAVRSTLEALGRGRPLDGLPSAVLTAALGLSGLDVRDDDARLAASRALITAANAEAPVRLARFAPLVSAAHDAGEPAAREIVDRAAGFLAENALAAREPGESTPVVLVGSVLGGASPVGELVRRRLAGLEVLTSSDGVLGAAWLAAVDAFGEGAPRPRPERD